MPISPDEAAQVAAKNGLSLADARAIAAMADSVQHARRLAAWFVDPITYRTTDARTA